MKTNQEFRESLKADINISQEYLEKQLKGLSDTYLTQNDIKSRMYFSYLICAIYLTYKEIYPDLSIYIPFRIKSDASFSRNIYKEFNKELNSIDFKNLHDEKESEKLKDSFSLKNASSDISAATIVLAHIKSSLKTTVDYVSPEIERLRQQRENNRIFIEDVENKLKDNFFGEEEYYLLAEETLERIIDSTYDEFTQERLIPYKTELTQILNIYKIQSESENFSTTLTTEEFTNLKSLLSDLRSRLSDKLQYEVLRETLPNVFNAPIIKNALHANVEFVKDSKKPNGFAAIYFLIHTPYGEIELQLQSNKRFYEAKKGSAFHSGIKGKSVNIDSFFELVDPNDENDLEFYLKKLDSFPADQIISEVELPTFKNENEKEEFYKTDFGKKYLASKKTKEYMKHIKIKDSIVFEPDLTIHTDTGDYSANLEEWTTVQQPTEIDTDDYLLSLALSLSPYMNVCHSGHTSYSTANTQAKSLEDEFAEILRKKDSITCLRSILIERLKKVLKTIEAEKTITKKPESLRDNLINCYLNNIHLKSLLPNDVSRADIIEYAKELNNDLEHKNQQPEL